MCTVYNLSLVRRFRLFGGFRLRRCRCAIVAAFGVCFCILLGLCSFLIQALARRVQRRHFLFFELAQFGLMLFLLQSLACQLVNPAHCSTCANLRFCAFFAVRAVSIAFACSRRFSNSKLSASCNDGRRSSPHTHTHHTHTHICTCRVPAWLQPP